MRHGENGGNGDNERDHVLQINEVLKSNLTHEMFAELEDTFLIASDATHTHIPFSKLPLALKSLGMSINEIDTTRIPADGITFEKFVEIVLVCLKHPNWAANEMNEVFCLFDKDHSGNIDASELRRVFTRFGESIMEIELEDQLREFDIDGDAVVCALYNPYFYTYIQIISCGF